MKSPLYAALMCALTAPATAADATWVVGLAVVAQDQPYAGTSADFSVFPLVSRQSSDESRFYARGPGVGFWLFDDGSKWRLGLGASARLDGYEAGDSDALFGMAKRRWSIDGGADIEYRSERAGIAALGFDTDLLGRHQGQTARLSWRLPQDILGFSPEANIWHESADLLDYYYGVRSNEARAGRPAYQADSGTSFGVALQRLQPLSGPWSMTFRFEARTLPSSVKDSPIVDASYRSSAFIALLYSFD